MQISFNSDGCCDMGEDCFQRRCEWYAVLTMTTGDPNSSCVMIATVNSQYKGRGNGSSFSVVLNGWPQCKETSIVEGHVLEDNQYKTVFRQELECRDCTAAM